MDLEKILAQLRSDLENVDSAILSLERLQQATTKRRGRPPLWLSENNHNKTEKPRRSKPRGSEGGNKGE